MKAYQIAIGIIIFQLSIPVAAAIGFPGPLSASEGGLLGVAMGDLSAWIESIGISALAGLATSRVFDIQINAGALVFAGAFFVGNIPLVSLLSRLVELNLMLSSLSLVIRLATYVVFFFAFIQLASSPAGGGY